MQRRLVRLLRGTSPNILGTSQASLTALAHVWPSGCPPTHPSRVVALGDGAPLRSDGSGWLLIGTC